MVNKNTSYPSTNHAVEDAIVKYKHGESIEDCLAWINSEMGRLTEWVSETELFFNDDYFFVTSEYELFVLDDNILEYFDIEELDLTESSDILDFIRARADGLFQDGPAAHFHNRDGICITADCEIWGQAGAHFTNFNIYKSKEDYLESLKDKGFMLWFGEFFSHTDDELISMFKKNITDKYF